jgi:hypothetical protein
VVEVKTVEKLMPIHDAQLLTYLKLKRHSRRVVAQLQHACPQEWHQEARPVMNPASRHTLFLCASVVHLQH